MGNKILADKLTRTCANLEIQHGGIGQVIHFVVPNTIQCLVIDEVATKVHHWDTNDIKSNCFDYCELYTAYQIKETLKPMPALFLCFMKKMLCAISAMKMGFGQQLLLRLSRNCQQKI